MSVHPEQMALFAPLRMALTCPQPGTLADRALTRLLDGRSLDHPTFEAESGSWRLAAVVFELRALGWPIRAAEKPAPTPSCPSRRFAVYRLSERDLAELLALRVGVKT
jgi:hypothetical protein